MALMDSLLAALAGLTMTTQATTPDVAPVPPPRPAALSFVAEEPPAPAEPPGEARPAPAADDPAEEPAVAQEPPRIYQAACPALLDGIIAGVALPPIIDGECGERSPLRIDAVNLGATPIEVSGEPQSACGMAEAFASWIAELDRYAEATLETGIATVSAGTSYQCRGVNNATTGRLSEHAFANALDVIGFVFDDDSRVTVEADWQNPPQSPEAKFLAYAHESACARFTTVLGPEANELHHDHLHLDLGCHGAACTMRLCE